VFQYYVIAAAGTTGAAAAFCISTSGAESFSEREEQQLDSKLLNKEHTAALLYVSL